MAGAIVPPLLLLLDWQWSMAMVALACAVFAWASQPLRASLDADRVRGQLVQLGNFATPIRLVLHHRALATMAACSFFFSMVQMSLTTYLVTFLHDDLAYGLVAAGLALSLTQLGGIVGRIVWGYVADRWLGAPRMLIVLACVMALCAGLTVWLTPAMPAWMVWLILVFFGSSAIGWNGVYLSEVARQAPQGMASVATGGTLAFTFLGVVIGPLLFGLFSGAMGSYRAGFMALMAIAALAALILILNQRRSH
jgi:sugar phosphate permease